MIDNCQSCMYNRNIFKRIFNFENLDKLDKKERIYIMNKNKGKILTIAMVIVMLCVSIIYVRVQMKEDY